MEAIFNRVLKNKIIKIMKSYLDDDTNELILDFPLSIGFYHTIEYVNITNDIMLHMFDFDFDYPFLFDDLYEEDKLRVYQILKELS
jgi:hypothetical protein